MSTGMEKKRKLSETIVKTNDQTTRKKTTRLWAALDLATLANIFDLLPSHELFWNVSFVCRSWQLACWDKLFWSSDSCFDLTAVAPFPSCGDDDLKSSSSMLKEYHDNRCWKLMNILQTILYGEPLICRDAYGNPLTKWRSSIKTLRIPFGLEIDDELLLYLSNWLPNVVSLGLLGPSKISSMGFSLMGGRYRFKSLEQVHLGDLSGINFYEFLRGFGRRRGLRMRRKELHISKKDFTLDYWLVVDMAPAVLLFDKVVIEGGCLYREGLYQLIRRIARIRKVSHTLEFSKCVFCDPGGTVVIPQILEPSKKDYFPFKVMRPGNIKRGYIPCSPSKLCFERSDGLFKWWISDDN